MIRSKGHFWIGSRPEWVLEFSLAGALSTIGPLGTWWASVPVNRWPDDERAHAYARSRWAEPFGDRRQEIVFIGAGIDWPQLKSRLDACLIGTEEGDDLTAFADLPDPFPPFRRADQAA